MYFACTDSAVFKESMCSEVIFVQFLVKFGLTYKSYLIDKEQRKV